MKKAMVSILAGALLMGTAVASFADDKIADRKENQQDRIAQGVKNGTLSPGETAHLEKNEAKLNKEKAQVNRQQNHLSKQIYKTKHDGKGK